MKKPKFFVAFLIFILFFSPNFSQANDMAPKYGPERIRQCEQPSYDRIREGKDDGETLKIDMDTSLIPSRDNLGTDFMFEMSNHYCARYFAVYWLAFKIANNTTALACGVVPSTSLSINPIKDVAVYLRNYTKAIKAIIRPDPICFDSFAKTSGLFAIAGIQAGITADKARKTIRRVRVCGYNWSQPTYQDDKIDYPKKGEGVSYQKYLATKSSQKIYKESEELDNSGRYFKIDDVISQNNKNSDYIRKNIINNNDCKTEEGNRNVLESMGPFYLRGLDPGNFNCGKYQGNEQKCCESLAKNYICLEDVESDRDPTMRRFVFCKKGTTCRFDVPGLIDPLVEFAVKEREEGRVLCAESHNLCPYNFSVAGGTTYPKKQTSSDAQALEKSFKTLKDQFISTESQDLSSPPENANALLAEDLPCANSQTQNEETCMPKENSHQLMNQCQYYTHCTIASDTPYTIRDRKINRYFSYACLNFKGLNGDQAQQAQILGNEINLSAPVAQCFYETFGNIFANKNGHTLCKSGEITNGEACINGSILKEYEKGQSDGQNIFTNIQNNLQYAIKVAMTLAIVFFGIKMLMAPGDVIGMSKRKEIILLIFKIGIVSYFALGDAWKVAFFDAIYGSFPELVAKFFQYTSAEGDMCKLANLPTINSENLNNITSLKYLQVFNLLDCKLKYYLAFTPGTSTANIVGLIISTMFTGVYGFLISISIFFFAIMMLLVIIRALYLFVTSALAIVVYIFISPVIFPTLLFKRTQNIFNTWFMQLISFALQPIILFVYIAIFIQASDLLILGANPKFTDHGAKIDCSNNYEQSFKKGKSFACILQFNEFSKSSAFAIISIGIPSAGRLFADMLGGGKMGIIFVVLRGVVGIYLLLKMFDLIPGIIDYIFGSSLDKSGQDALNTFKSFVSKANFAQKIATSLAWNNAFNMAENIKNGGGSGKKQEGSSDKSAKEEDNGAG